MFSFVVFAVSVDKGSKKMVIANFQCIYYWYKVGYICAMESTISPRTL